MSEIIIAANDGWIQYTAAGSDPSFVYDFPIFDEAHIQVLTAADADTSPTAKTLTTDYTVTGVDAVGGGTVVPTAAWVPAAGEIVTLLRDVPYARTTDFTQAGSFKASTINRELDLIAMMLQQIDRRLQRAVVLQDGDAAATMELPLLSARLNGYSGWGGTGLPVSLAAPAGTTSVTTFMATVLGSNDATELITNGGFGTAAAEDAAAGSGDVLRTDGDVSGTTGRLFDIPFNGGFLSDGTGTDLVAAQAYGVVVVDRAIEILGAALACQVAPVGDSLICSFEVSTDQGGSWTDIFSTLPKILTTAKVDDAAEVIKTDGTEDIAAGSLIRLVVDQVGSSTAGQQLSTVLRAKTA